MRDSADDLPLICRHSAAFPPFFGTRARTRRLAMARAGDEGGRRGAKACQRMRRSMAGPTAAAGPGWRAGDTWVLYAQLTRVQPLGGRWLRSRNMASSTGEDDASSKGVGAQSRKLRGSIAPGTCANGVGCGKLGRRPRIDWPCRGSTANGTRIARGRACRKWRCGRGDGCTEQRWTLGRRPRAAPVRRSANADGADSQPRFGCGHRANAGRALVATQPLKMSSREGTYARRRQRQRWPFRQADLPFSGRCPPPPPACSQVVRRSRSRRPRRSSTRWTR